MSQTGTTPPPYDPLGPNFLEFVQEGQLLRHKPSGLVGKCVAKDRTAWINDRVHHLYNFVKATLEFPSGRKISFTHEVLEEVPENGG